MADSKPKVKQASLPAKVARRARGWGYFVRQLSVVGQRDMTLCPCMEFRMQWIGQILKARQTHSLHSACQQHLRLQLCSMQPQDGPHPGLGAGQLLLTLRKGVGSLQLGMVGRNGACSQLTVCLGGQIWDRVAVGTRLPCG